MTQWTVDCQVAEGRTSTVFQVSKRGCSQVYIKKQFKKNKSIASVSKEIELQQIAAHLGIAPKIIDTGFNTDPPYFVMEQVPCTLMDLLIQQKELSPEQFEALHCLYNVLDTVQIQHNDANLANIAVYPPSNNGNAVQFGLMDFGMATRSCTKTNQGSYKLLVMRICRELQAIKHIHS